MVGNILVAHGMRKGNQNKALAEFIATLLKDEDYHYELAFLESDTQSLELTMERMVHQGIKEFRIVPLLIFSAMHYMSDIPDILMEMQNKYPNISSHISEPLGTHPYMKALVERRIDDVKLSDDSNAAVVIIAHGNGSGRFTKAHDELIDFVEAVDSKQPVYARTLYGALTFRNDLEEISKQYDELIIVPLFFFDGRLVNKVKGVIDEMPIHCNLHITPSINFDGSLKLIIRERFEALYV
ncbi:sirohydrochlorin chelatase [Staphylococcus pasteuri]|uniref:sirohydrochlorin chelatase n=1 Tax=Staphylococcus pasteuri TaxID=45972 RepID=UPI000623D394|nr:sirohydrochlorin chelatase [Staphylococcus pasteuri]